MSQLACCIPGGGEKVSGFTAAEFAAEVKSRLFSPSPIERDEGVLSLRAALQEPSPAQTNWSVPSILQELKKAGVVKMLLEKVTKEVGATAVAEPHIFSLLVDALLIVLESNSAFKLISLTTTALPQSVLSGNPAGSPLRRSRTWSTEWTSAGHALVKEAVEGGLVEKLCNFVVDSMSTAVSASTSSLLSTCIHCVGRLAGAGSEALDAIVARADLLDCLFSLIDSDKRESVGQRTADVKNAVKEASTAGEGSKRGRGREGTSEDEDQADFPAPPPSAIFDPIESAWSSGERSLSMEAARCIALIVLSGLEGMEVVMRHADIDRLQALRRTLSLVRGWEWTDAPSTAPPLTSKLDMDSTTNFLSLPDEGSSEVSAFKVLGLDIRATLWQIESAFLRLCLKYHPGRRQRKQTRRSSKKLMKMLVGDGPPQPAVGASTSKQGAVHPSAVSDIDEELRRMLENCTDEDDVSGTNWEMKRRVALYARGKWAWRTLSGARDDDEEDEKVKSRQKEKDRNRRFFSAWKRERARTESGSASDANNTNTSEEGVSSLVNALSFDGVEGTLMKRSSKVPGGLLWRKRLIIVSNDAVECYEVEKSGRKGKLKSRLVLDASSGLEEALYINQKRSFCFAVFNSRKYWVFDAGNRRNRNAWCVSLRHRMKG
mmetsp:Transcript_1537/g.3092  ORF Transcript_1537/g.3092 Transcript_1537/m.3092 type:complete len:659 (-) Transcript_1537:839-2815(-)